MYYLPTDYLVLTAIRDKKTALDTLLEAACASLPYPLSKDALAFSLGKLRTGGYIKGYALTEKGLTFFKSNKKFLESKSRADARLCQLLCVEQVTGTITPYELSDSAYVEACDALRRKYSIPSPDFTVEQGENSLILRFAGYGSEDQDEYTDEQSIAINAPSLCALAHTFVQFYKDGRHHKCCLYADGAPAYVATVSINDDTTRLNISKILFNRQRFIGKCDGNLDYAQCGDSVFDRTDSKIDEYVLLAMLETERILLEDFPYEDVEILWEMC
ncbi:MAG: hypothetical protein IJW70_03825 [Clostridia bacterium]|nr:hypothetical protein [Clostridia bacterium]